MKRVEKIHTDKTPHGTMYKLHLQCGHTKIVDPLGNKKAYRLAPSQKRATCNICEKEFPPEKTCADCGIAKPYSDFYIARDCSDGHQKRCKICQRKYISSLGANKPKIMAGKKPAFGATKAMWKAINMLKSAVVQGRIQKPSLCEQCARPGQLDGHHHDYSQPYNVTWLCRACHLGWHRMFGEGKNSGR